MAKNYFKSYIWLLETLRSRGPLTLSEIKDLWMRSSVNDEGKELATRTFANHVSSIADIFGIDIVCDRRDNTYRIDNGEELGGSGIREWMMEALSLNNLINESTGLRDRILFEAEPSAHRFLTVVIRAMKDGRMLLVNYRGFDMEAPQDFLLEPYCVKEYKRRWHLFAHEHGADYEGPHNFALDRIIDAEVSSELFSPPKDFDGRDFFFNRYGVRQYDGEVPEVIRIRASALQAGFLRSLPLHRSQEEEIREKDYSVFRYHLIPNWDFRHDLLYYGAGVEVLEPSHLRKEMAQEAGTMKLNYENTTR